MPSVPPAGDFKDRYVWLVYLGSGEHERLQGVYAREQLAQAFVLEWMSKGTVTAHIHKQKVIT